MDNDTYNAMIAGVGAGIGYNLKIWWRAAEPKLKAALPRWGTSLGRFTGRCLRAYRRKRDDRSSPGIGR